jgi:TolB-like protein/DNA-binding winged helix-turn-helix (wHTH) protein/Tfp pilus assembly protein PilF
MEPRQTYHFDGFELDPRSGELRKDGQSTRLPEQPCQILTLLLARAGEVVSRDELRRALWPADTFVDFDVSLNSAVKRLRDALGDSAGRPRYVETLPRRGYRFVAPVVVVPIPTPVSPPAPFPLSPPPPTEVPVPAPRRRALTPRRMGIASAALVLVAVALATWPRRPDRPPTLASARTRPIRSVVVLPFENLSNDPGQEYFVDGMTDAVTTDLAQVRALRVISRASVMQYKKTRRTLREIASDLGVDAVVQGAVARSGNSVRVTAHLIDAATEEHLWARTYDRELRDVLTLQREVAAAIADAIQVELRPAERRRLAAPTSVDPDAYEAYLKGRFYWSTRTAEGKKKAAHFFEESIAKDPTYAPAYSGLSDTYRMFGIGGLPPSEYMPRAEAAARKALALDDGLAEAHASLAGVLYRYRWDWRGAEREFRLSLELDPASAEAHRAYAVYLMALRRNEDAVPEARRAWDLSPLSPVINVELGLALVRAGRFAEAVQRLNKTLEIAPDFWRVYATMAQVHQRQGDWEGAVALLEKANSFGNHDAIPWLAYAYARSRQRARAQALLARLKTLGPGEYVSPQSLALVHLGLGEKDAALALLEKAFDAHAFEVLGFAGEIYEGLHDDPRFQDLLRRMGMTEVIGGPSPAAAKEDLRGGSHPLG